MSCTPGPEGNATPAVPPPKVRFPINLTPKKVRFPIDLTSKKVRFPINSALPCTFRLLNLPFFYAAGGGGEVPDPVEAAV